MTMALPKIPEKDSDTLTIRGSNPVAIFSPLLLPSPVILESRCNIVEKAQDMHSSVGALKTFILREQGKGLGGGYNMGRQL